MLRLLAPVVESLRRRRLNHMPSACGRLDSETPRDDGSVISQLCRTLDRAVELGLWEHAHRVADTAVRLAHRSAELALRVARLRIMNGDVENALTILESCTGPSAEVEHLRILCLLETGRTRDAHLELIALERCHRGSASARLLLGLLEWNLGDPESAISTLIAGGVCEPNVHALQALTAVCTSIGRLDMVRIWSQRLRKLLGNGRLTNEPWPAWALSEPHEARAWLALTVDRLLQEQLPTADHAPVDDASPNQVPASTQEAKPTDPLRFPMTEGIRADLREERVAA